MMEFSKKQLKAITDIIKIGQKDRDAYRERYNSTVKNESEKIPPHTYGERWSPRSYEVMCGYFGVTYPESIPDIVHDDDDVMQKPLIFDIISKYISDSYLVREPFSGLIKASKAVSQIKEHKFRCVRTLGSSYDGDIIEFSATKLDDSTVVAGFNPRYVRLALEAIGGEVVMYLGFQPGGKVPYLIIRPADSETKPLEETMNAVVLPVRGYKKKN